MKTPTGKSNINWICHFVSDLFYDCCNDNTPHEHVFLEGLCDAHTHGMEEFYNHREFQIVLLLHPSIAGQILNDMGLLVQGGKKFKDGDIVSDILYNYDIKLKEFESNGKQVLRILLPDENGYFPDETACEEGIKQQLLSTPMLYKEYYSNHPFVNFDVYDRQSMPKWWIARSVARIAHGDFGMADKIYSTYPKCTEKYSALKEDSFCHIGIFEYKGNEYGLFINADIGNIYVDTVGDLFDIIEIC